MGSKARVWIWIHVSLPFELQLPPWSSSVSVTGFCNSHCPDIYQGHIKCSLCLWSVVIKTLFYQIHGGQPAPFRRWAVVASEFSVRTKKKKKCVSKNVIKNPPAMRETWVQSLGWEDPLRRERLPTPVFWPGEFCGLYSLYGRKETDMTQQLSLSLFLDRVIFSFFLSSLC